MRRSSTALIGLMAVVFAVLAWYVLGFQSYLIMPDELGYMKSALTLGQDLVPNVRGDLWFNNYSQFAQVLIAPAYGLLSTPTAFDASHLIYAAAMTSTAIPVYLLARRIGASGRLGLLAGAVAITVPWIAMSATLMTEAVAYPVFAWTMLAYYDAVARPGPRSDLLAVVATAIAFLTRTQFAALAAALAIAIVAYELLSALHRPNVRPMRVPIEAARSLWTAHRVALSIGAVLLLLVVAGPLGRSSFGAYEVTLSGDLLPAGFWPILHNLVAEVVVAVGVLPALALVASIIQAAGRRATAEERAFACVALATTTVLLLEVGSFAVRFSAGANDRYVFYLVVLCAVALAMVLRPGRLPGWPILAAAAGATWLLATSTLLNIGPSMVAVTSTYQVVLDGRADQIGSFLGIADLSAEDAMAVATVLLALAFVAGRRWLSSAAVAGIACLIVVGWCVAETGYTLKRLRNTQIGASPGFIAGRDWLDRALPSGAKAGIVLSNVFDPPTTAAVFWDTSFWTKEGDRLYGALGAPIYDQEFSRPFEIDPKSGRIPALDARAWLVRAFNDRRFALVGQRVIATHDPLTLIRAQRPYRASWTFAAHDDTGTMVPGDTATMRVYADQPGRSARTLRLSFVTAYGQQRSSTVRISGPNVSVTRRIAPTPSPRNTLVVTVRLPPTGAATLRLHVGPMGTSLQLVTVD